MTGDQELAIRRSSFFDTIKNWAELVKFSHTIFALPFALGAAVVVSRSVSVTLGALCWILLAMVGARTAAMTFNRLLDAAIDAKNPRTRNREIPAGKVSRTSGYILLAVSSVLFFVASAGLGLHCLVFAPAVLAFLFFYSWTKRFTSSAHLVLGVALALAPGGVWYALTARVSSVPFWLMCAVALWVCGFDILYSCQDREFDRAQELHSVPVRCGVAGAFLIAKVCHGLAVVLLVFFGLAAALGPWYFVGVGLFAFLLLSQYWIVSAEDFSRVDQTFFTRNGWASLGLFAFILLDRFA